VQPHDRKPISDHGRGRLGRQPLPPPAPRQVVAELPATVLVVDAQQTHRPDRLAVAELTGLRLLVHSL
jgi:hypothetical protein